MIARCDLVARSGGTPDLGLSDGQLSALDSTVHGFDEFSERMVGGCADAGADPLFRYGLDQGRYAERIAEWQAIFGSDLRIVWFDDLARDPRAVVTSIASFAGLDPGFYRDFHFQVSNEVRVVSNAVVRSVYRTTARRLRGYGTEPPLKRLRCARSPIQRIDRARND